MPTIKERATEKAGPLPVWAWGVIIGGALFLYWRHRQKAAAVDTTVSDTSSSVGSEYDDDQYQPTTVTVVDEDQAPTVTKPSPVAHRPSPIHHKTGTVKKVGRKPTLPVNKPFHGDPIINRDRGGDFRSGSPVKYLPVASSSHKKAKAPVSASGNVNQRTGERRYPATYEYPQRVGRKNLRYHRTYQYSEPGGI